MIAVPSPQELLVPPKDDLVIPGLSTSLGAPLTISPSHLFRSTDERSKAGPIWSEYEQVGIDPFH
jgi:hypothetical protein